MKKLLITSMAAVAIGLYAKADFTANESFEGSNEGPFFDVNETTGKYIYGLDWTSEATPEDGIFTVTNISKITSVGDSYPTDRLLSGDNLNALAIDTEKSLIRKVISGSSDELEGALLEGEGGAPIFFDSVVQFTATDAKPTPGNDDKLMVWLYASDDVDNDNPGVFGETTPTTNLIITASYNESGTFVVTNYLTGVEIAPDSWHRLTIKSFKDSGYLKFNVWVDKTLVTVGTESDFISLQYAPGNVDGTLKGVAFEGKGVVDDLVFTTTAPEFAEGGEEPEDQTANVVIKFNNLAAIADANDTGIVFMVNNDEDNTHYISTLSTNFVLNVGSSATLQFMLNEGYELESPDSASCVEEVYTITINELTSAGATIEIVATSTGGGDNVPTLDVTSYDNGEDLKADVKSGTKITVPRDWSVDGKELKDAKGNTFATFASYYILTQDGLTVAVTLDQKAAAPFAEATDLTEGQEVLDLDETIGEEGSKVPAVGVRIKTYSGLWYGLGTAAELGTSSSWTGPVSWTQSDSDGKVIQLKAAKEGDTRFYRIEVKDINPNPAQ